MRKQRRIKEISLDEDFQDDGDIVPMEVADWAPNPEQLCWASELRRILWGLSTTFVQFRGWYLYCATLRASPSIRRGRAQHESHGGESAPLAGSLAGREALSEHFSQKKESAQVDFSLLRRHDTNSRIANAGPAPRTDTSGLFEPVITQADLDSG